MLQQYTSANTSIKQVPAVFKNLRIEKGMTILDYGCGKYDLAKEYVESFGATYYGYDKYNRTDEENQIALACDPDLIVCANVLNVIKEDEVIEEIMEEITHYGCDVVFSVYEGDKSGEGKETVKGYQRNEKATNYFKFFEVFDGVQRHGNTFYCMMDLAFEGENYGDIEALLY